MRPPPDTTIHPLRELLRMSQDEYAQLLGVDLRTVIRWETDKSSPSGCSAEIIYGLAEAFQRHPEREAELRHYINRSSDVGGISYLLVRLLDDVLCSEQVKR